MKGHPLPNLIGTSKSIIFPFVSIALLLIRLTAKFSLEFTLLNFQTTPKRPSPNRFSCVACFIISS